MESPIQSVLQQADKRMRQAVEALRRELASIRSGRASPSLVEHIRVDYHGVSTPLRQLASISTPEPRLLLIQPWERSTLGPIEKAILKSDLGLTPANDGNVVRLAIPTLTEERRQQLVKLVHKRVEEGRVELRNIRRDCLEETRRQEKEKTISADDQKRATTQLQKLLDGFTSEANHIGQEKEAELMEV